jgi:hypothetical protein
MQLQAAAPAAPAQSAPLAASQTQLQPFIEVDACLPINVLIQPNASADAGYMVTLEAEADALDAFNFTVADSVLRLESAGNLTTNRPIKITGQLCSVSVPTRLLLVPAGMGEGEHASRAQLPLASALSSLPCLPVSLPPCHPATLAACSLHAQQRPPGRQPPGHR